MPILEAMSNSMDDIRNDRTVEVKAIVVGFGVCKLKNSFQLAENWLVSIDGPIKGVRCCGFNLK